MIYITGDTHGERELFTQNRLPGEADWTADDILIVCGDFGYVFLNTEDEAAFLDFLATKPYTICFCDGNHENFPAIYRYPRVRWNGGNVHRIRQNVLHLMRGQVFEINGKRFFTMGGAYSRDKETRQEGRDYWPEELPDNAEYREAYTNLRDCGNRVDVILTHTASRRTIRKLGGRLSEEDAELTGFLDWLEDEVSFDKWFFGHWHIDRQIDDRHIALRYNILRLE